ncbi:antibiotic biosynthesis monooxygenase [Frankia sp. CNm7]|uniref:Antibiotic biosynthesis monooxygenase n=1 Tax=Frankia nepalensis TaxID=1836974 RepID=A0A937RAK9_9ACTN|nr:antibiotic biosynthesis monooxygenase [Frankia nepalensis]MBL7502279.1 antibiotic biosynthesis monooxygenase [Frankia nepalensis]MBL7515749.1 antibiotic biosynthesis monooxygenase [Frankia nepalensis]MBL7517815.1 antibiotic biosynthesis monooxygenase [Frankia nepalensis]MBL7628506.1 antibiotic biosynthesis monooxygenase [Frankia nepalensis]
MSVVKINVLTVPAEQRATLEARFGGRAGMVERADGFEHFELLRPVEGTDTYLVYTRWRSEEDFQAWASSQAFSEGHRQAAASATPGGGHPGGHPGGRPGGGHPGGGHPGGGPAASGAQLWSFEVVQQAGPK